MKILYDHQIFTTQKYGGISRYFYELIKEFKGIDSIKTTVSLLLSNNHYISDKKYVNHIGFFPNSEFRGKIRLNTIINKFASIREIKKQNFDIFHPTYYDPYFLSYMSSKPFVLTVYDMIHEKNSEFFSDHGVTSKNKRCLVERSTKIIAISESTKNDLIELYDVDASKIEVIYLGNSMIPNDKMVSDFSIPEMYILFVGSRGGYKNFNTFIKSISTLLDENVGLSVVCVGGGGFNVGELSLFSKLNIQEKIFQYNLDDEVLAQFYRNAIMFVFPSLYEGFGIPILEAFACECPLVCSNTSSLKEIADDGAEYFDPYSEQSIYNATEKVLNSLVERTRLINNGTKRLLHFSWEKTAEKTLKVYESIIK